MDSLPMAKESGVNLFTLSMFMKDSSKTIFSKEKEKLTTLSKELHTKANSSTESSMDKV